MKYLARLKQSPQELEDNQLKKQVELAKLQLSGDLLETQSKLAEVELHLENLKNSYPLRVENILKTQDEVEAYKRGLKAIEELQKELF